MPIDSAKDYEALCKYERMLDRLYIQYAKEREIGKPVLKDSELYQKIMRGKMLVEEWRRQRLLGIFT